MKKIAALIAFAVLFVSACASNKMPTPIEKNMDVAEIEYHIGVSDSLSINVWRNKELSVAVPVRPDGRISIPLIGDVDAAGLTSMELAKGITKKLGKFVRNPQVTVIVTNPSSTDFQRRVRITGAVNSPISVAYRDGMTVLDLVLLAGGVNDFASANSSRLYRKVNGEIQNYPVYMDEILEKGELRTNYPLAPSDIITVPERAF